jgi:lambda family phage portal protein
MGIGTQIIDGMFAAFSPRAAIRRNYDRRQLAKIEAMGAELDRRRRDSLSGGGYQSAENGRDAHSWLTSRLSPDSSLEADREEMCRRADSAYKNYELATNHVEGRVVRVAGSGMTVEPEIGFDVEFDNPVNEETGKRWNEKLRINWDRTCERIGRNGEELWEIQHSLQRNYERRMEWFLLVGDEYDPLAPTSLKVESIDPDRVSTPPGKEGDKSVRMGIKLNAMGRGIGCYVRDTHPGDTVEVKQTWTYYPFFLKNGLPRMIHHFVRFWDGQHRGYPRMQVGLKRLKNSEEYSDAELERNYIAACFAAIVRTDLDPEDMQDMMGSVADSSGKRVKDISPGQFHYIGQSDQIEMAEPSGPSGSFAPYMDHAARMFAAGAGTSAELLTGNWQGLSYSAGRVIWNIEEATTAVIQLGHEKTVKWLYRHFVTRAINVGIIDVDSVAYRSDPWTYWASRVIYPPKSSIDPAREDRNEMVKVEAGLMPASELVERYNGKTARQVYAAVKRDRELREEFDIEVHMPQMGRDQELMPDAEGSGPTQPGDTNQESSDANSERQAVGA